MITKCILGLGNPERKYEKTRHNAGFIFVDSFAHYLSRNKWEVTAEKTIKDIVTYQILQLNDYRVILSKPLTYMNLSGKAATYLKHEFYLKDNRNFLIVMDELDLDIGASKLAFNKYSKTHNGILSVRDNIGINWFTLRFGIGKELPAEEYVLKNFRPDEYEKLIESIQSSFKLVFTSFLYNREET